MDLHQHHHSTTHPNPNAPPGISEGDRLLGVAEKLLQTRDLSGSREFALLAQESEPLLEGSDQILAITDVLLASERRVVNNRHHDWYAILQINPLSLSSDPDLLKKNYRRLALLLHPDKNHFPLADVAFKLVADAWALLSDPSRRGLYDHELSVYEKGGLQHQNHPPPPHAEKDKLPVRRSQHQQGGGTGGGSGDGGRSQPKTAGGKFWTACPYCYVLFEYSRRYEDCCLRCQNCERAYHAAAISSLPPMVPGKEAYYCCWGFFPLGFSLENGSMGKKVGSADNHGINNGHNPSAVFPNWMPSGEGTFPTPQGGGANLNMGGGIDISDGGGGGDNGVSGGFARGSAGMAKPGAKKRGRPRKNP